MTRFLRRSIGRKLLVAVGLPSALAAVGGALWLHHLASHADPGLELALRLAMGALLLFSILVSVLHAVAIRVVLEEPLRRLAEAMRRSRDGDFLQRLDARGEDELAELARTFNATLAAVTDLHALRLDDAAERRALERELALKAQLEARVRELELLHRLTDALSASPDLETRGRKVAELAALRAPGAPFALLLADPASDQLVVQSLAGLPAQLIGQHLPPGAGLAGRAVRERRPQVLEGPEVAGAWLPGAAAPPAAVAVPMLHQDRCVGVLLYGLPAAAAFDEAEARLMGSAALLVATALENARLHQSMVRLSQTDNLTGVQNRRQFFARLELERERATRSGEPFALLMIDVDRFRELNEAVGHAAGDAVLRQVAALLTREARAVDLVARAGGEEFAVVLPGTGAEQALGIAERIRAAVAGTRFEGAPGGSLTVSVGVAGFPLQTSDLATLVDYADAALFAAKRSGRNATRAFAPGQEGDPDRRRNVGSTGRP